MSAFQVINVYVTGNAGDVQVSKNEMTNWFSGCLGCSVTKIEDLGAGWHYCQMLNLLFPSQNCLSLKNVKFDARNPADIINNWKILQGGFRKMGIDKIIPIEKLSKNKYMDNMEFSQWFKKFYDSNAVRDPAYGTYDPIAERAKLGKQVPTSSKGAVVKPAVRSTVAKKSPTTNGVAKAPQVPTQSVRTTVVPPKPQAQAAADAPIRQTRAVPAPSHATPAAQNTIKEQQTQIDELTTQVDEMQTTVDGLEKERDFYFGKLREIELICQDEGDDESHPVVIQRILEVLYATADGFELPDDVAAEAEGNEVETY